MCPGQGPGKKERHSVSCETFVPRQTALVLNTVNGGITWKLPKEYPAPLEASTNTDSIRASLPVPISGVVRKELMTSSGRGGAPVKAVTVNGGIAVNQGRDQFASLSDSPVKPAIAEEAPQR